MRIRHGARLAGLAFVVTWLPLSVWRGLAIGRSLRLSGASGSDWRPLADNVIVVAATMIAPAALVALVTFVFWAWAEERREARAARPPARAD